MNVNVFVGCNNVIANWIADTTSFSRFSSTPRMNWRKLNVQLTPESRMHFVAVNSTCTSLSDTVCMQVFLYLLTTGRI